jgi:hypothetical protein
LSRPNPRHPKPWHRGSSFGPGRRVPLCRERRARYSFLLHAHHKARRLTRAGRDIGLALLRRLGADGRCDPTHETLAGDVECCERTVATATATLRALNLLTWENRLKREGWRALQDSNAYQLLTPAENPPPAIGCKSRGATLSDRFSLKKEAQEQGGAQAMRDRTEDLVGLARVLREREARLRAIQMARYA